MLFDFERFEIVDCRFKPDLETALRRNLKQFHYSEYGDERKFAEIYWLFSREAVASGSLEKYAETLPKKHGATPGGLWTGGYQSIDDAFLEELDGHRDALAHTFKNRNPKLDSETLTEVTQRTLDRLVFMRFLEDKLIEPEYLVANFGQRGSAWAEFVAASRRLNGIYNGIVFKNNDILDSKDFKVDDDQFGRVCEALCHINSPYDFNVIPLHILGSIYERFLGKVIVATDKRARVEEKPEVRKAGGVYYTPEYIVRYIVENTVGKLIEGKTPSQIAKMKFADIACGSGSFLLGVYDLLIRYHTKFYNDNPRAARGGETAKRDDGLHLSLQKKREILVNNLYGVDIDNQAVEVAQLSLYLKLLQDETPASARGYQMEFHETLLPSLHKNIVCGNSLIGMDILSGQLFASDAERKLNPMDFEQRFPTIIRRGGFDAILGNPPYGTETSPIAVDYLRSRYHTLANSLDTFIAFVERAASLIKPDGYLGYIIPSGWVSTPSSEKLRILFAAQFLPDSFVSLPYDVFAGAYVDTLIVTARKSEKDPGWREKTDSRVKLVVFPVRFKIRGLEDFDRFKKLGSLGSWNKTGFLVTASSDEAKLVSKLKRQKRQFNDVVEVMRGVEEFNPRAETGMKRPRRAFNGQLRRYTLALGPLAFEDYTQEIEAAKPWRFFSGSRLLLRQLVSRQFRLQAVLPMRIF
ncbi:MAG: class I SAM-dependent DNA methyltransferase [Limisphaerales bacterium]